jgi:hypothetical protein
MELTYISLITFLLTTLFYFYYFKLPLTVQNMSDSTNIMQIPTAPPMGSEMQIPTATPIEPSAPELKNMVGGALGDNGQYPSYGDYMTSNMPRLLTYFGIVLIEQFGFNLATIVSKCGGTVGKNIAVSLLMTIVPWTLIFGAVIAMLIVYPGLKSAFADVVGYFFVYSEANDILGTIIVDTNIEQAINATSGTNVKQTTELKKAAEAIMKMYGNKSILINTMNPDNFESVWDVLQPLMSSAITPAQKEQFKGQLFQLIVKKDNIGEGMWYVYTGLLLSSIVSYNLVTRGCEKNLEKMQEEHEEYIDKVKKMNETKSQNQSGPSYKM